eukprot:CAMPEP_0172492284 /NCGR_PEP_ID=MMETSP1066-20121228/23372_1 /TAXON_ID=671091 /ORGANISM="Coscinodiscus wailesii, Strain CCMP2513" /LENGTH=376 /DNA_ID=CAMNT_0013261803 /DNA_START=128 /DNA_END=1255 /DNA_ORIENTATION=+
MYDFGFDFAPSKQRHQPSGSDSRWSLSSSPSSGAKDCKQEAFDTATNEEGRRNFRRDVTSATKNTNKPAEKKFAMTDSTKHSDRSRRLDCKSETPFQDVDDFRGSPPSSSSSRMKTSSGKRGQQHRKAPESLPKEYDNNSFMSSSSSSTSSSCFSSHNHSELKNTRALTTSTTKKEVMEQNDNQPILKLGSRVEGRYGGGSDYYPGTITRVRKNGGFDVSYDDGDEEINVPFSLLRPLGRYPSGSGNDDDKSDNENSSPLLNVGDRVEANFRGGAGGREMWYTGVISKVRYFGEKPAFDVDYDDGDVDTGLSKESIRLIDDGTKKMQLQMKTTGRGLEKANDLTNEISMDNCGSCDSSSEQFNLGDRVEGKFRGRG